MTAPNMADMPYHFGIKLAAHPTQKQKNIIKRNSDASRFVYNVLIGIDQEMFQLKRVDLLHQSRHKDYQKLIDYFVEKKHVSLEFAKFMVEHRYVSDKTVKKAKAKNCYKFNKFKSTGYPMIDERIQQLTERKKSGKTLGGEYRWLYHKDIDSMCISQGFQTNKKAWNIYSKVHSAGTPKFHRKSYEENYQTGVHYAPKVKKNDYPNMINGNIKFLDRHHIVLPKIGAVYVTHMRDFIWNHRNEIRIGTATIHKDNTGCYTISIQVGSEKPFVMPLEKTGKQLGIDLNTENFLTSSNGIMVPNPRYYKHSLTRLRKQQRILSRRIRRAKDDNRSIIESSNVQKQRKVVAKIAKHVKNQRDTFINRVSMALIENQDLVVAEELRSSNLLKNHALAQSISDVGWRSLLQSLTYKADLYGKQFVTINPKNTTQMCRDCGYVCGSDDRHSKLELKDREWTCPNCGQHHIRDHNAAMNILDKGIKQLQETA